MDDRGFAEFVAARQAALLQLAWGLTGDRGLAEDLSQTALARTWVRWEHLAADGDPWRYLQKTTVSVYSTWWRRRWRREIPSPVVPERPAEDQHALVDAHEEMGSWLRQLPPRQRAVIVLRFLQDLSVDETARIIGCSPGTVKSQTSKALNHLRTRAATEKGGAS